MYPDTRGRISTDSTGSRRPVNSSHSFTSFSTTVTTLTGNGGAPLFAVGLLQSTTIRETAANAATVNSRFNLLSPSPRCLKEEPRATFSLVDPNFNQACCGNVTMFVTNVMSFAQTRGQRFVVVGQLSEHVQRLDIIVVIIEHALSSRNMTDRLERRATDLPDSFRDGIRHRKKLLSLFIQEQVIIAEMRATHVPMEIFRF